MTDARLSDRIQRIGASATMTITQTAREMKREGRDVISLSAGEPDFETPLHIQKAASQAMENGATRYTNVDGIPELKAAICRKFKRENQLDYTPAQINVSPGGKPVIFNALAVTIGAGDEVIIPAPCWVSYPDMVKLCGGTPIVIPCESTTAFKLTPEKLAENITPKTKWLFLNSPSNPTGAAYSATELAALAEVLRRHPNIMILCDDIYEHLVYDDFEFATLANVAPDLMDRILTMNGVSKAYAMTGWRIGYGGGPDWLIKAMSKYMGQTTSNPLNQMKGLSCLTPPGAFYAFVDVSMISDNDTSFALNLLNETGVATVPGTAFYAPGHIRLSYATSMDKLEAALNRIETFTQRG